MWRKIAEKTISTIIYKGIRQRATLQEIKDKIDKSYPFGQRINHPYKIWLDERKKAFIALGILEKRTDNVTSQSQKSSTKCDSTIHQQLSLFD